MFAREPRTLLICSALLGALVISCGGPPADVAASAPVPPQVAVLESRDAPEQERGLAEVAPRAPAPRAAPAPVPAPQSPPAAEQRAPEPPPAQRRPAGVPVGIRSPDIPKDNDPLNKDQWDDKIAEACERAGLDDQPRCLGVDYRFVDDNGNEIDDPGPDLYEKYNCDIERTPDPGEYIKLKAKILVVSTCTLPEESTSSTSGESNESNQQTENNENAEDETTERGDTNPSEQQSDNEQDETGTEDGAGE